MEFLLTRLLVTLYRAGSQHKLLYVSNLSSLDRHSLLKSLQTYLSTLPAPPPLEALLQNVLVISTVSLQEYLAALLSLQHLYNTESVQVTVIDRVNSYRHY